MLEATEVNSERVALRLSVAGNLFVGVVGLSFALLTGSQAILLDGGFNLVFFAMGLLTLRVSRLVEGPTSERFQFGFAAFEPLINTIKGLLVLAVSMMALIPAIQALLAGGRQMALGLGIVYAAVAMTVCLSLAVVQRAMLRRVASPLIEVDAKNWLVNGLISAVVGLAFLLAYLLQGTSLQWATPYVDPVLVIVLVALTLAIPLKMVLQGSRQLLGQAPESAVRTAVRQRTQELVDPHGLDEVYVRTSQIGRWLFVLVQIVLPQGHPLGEIAAMDQLRADLAASLEGVAPKLVIDAIFTGDRKWVLDPVDDAATAAPLRLE